MVTLKYPTRVITPGLLILSDARVCCSCVYYQGLVKTGSSVKLPCDLVSTYTIVTYSPYTDLDVYKRKNGVVEGYGGQLKKGEGEGKKGGWTPYNLYSSWVASNP